MSKPTTTKKAGETASYGGKAKRQYYPGKKSFMKKRAAKVSRAAWLARLAHESRI